MKDPIRISGTGCALADFLYTDVKFDGAAFAKYRSKKNGDGGLSPGKLVFTEDLENFSKVPYQEILAEITAFRKPDSFNIGGPSIVSLIHAAQLLENENAEVFFYGGLGKDEIARKIKSLLKKTPVNSINCRFIKDKASPFTDVLSDSTWLNGHGERTFINNIGAAWEYYPDNLDEHFFQSNIVCFGGTALVPPLHENLTNLLNHAKNDQSITIVNTVYDFFNERKSPGNRWPLVSNYHCFQLIDLLIMDKEEALKISGEKSILQAADYFKRSGTSSFVITNGAEEVFAFSNGDLFAPQELIRLPVSQKVKNDLKFNPELKGDTTGCGDNFAGGMIASVASQLKNQRKGNLDMIEALSWAIASGGVACFYKGGTFFEKYPGEKLALVKTYYEDYQKQIAPLYENILP